MSDASQSTIVLEPPKPVKPVTPASAGGMVKLDPDTQSLLDARVAEFVEAVLALDHHSSEFKGKVHAVHTLGNREVKEAASVSMRVLERPVRAMDEGLFRDTTPVSQSLVELRRTVEDLDPTRYDNLLTPKKLLGLIPMGNRLQDYFGKYQSAQSHINAIIESLYRGQDELRKDNAAIEQEKANLWQLMQKVEEYIHVGRKIDTALEARVEEIEAQDPEKARVVKEEMLFYIRQKVQDLLTQQAVNIQGYLALDLVRKNNLELIKGVDRATTTTVSALRTAVITAQALTNQRLVLDQISALNTTTGNLIESTSAMLRGQSVEIHRQAAGSTIALDQLKAAFDNVYQTMDMLTAYKGQALDAMKESVGALSTEVTRAKTYLDRVREAEIREEVAGLSVAEREVIQL
jgi:uncharacterized protein YaaN involved in tellurite resistance